MTTLLRRFSGTTGDVATVGTREEHHEGHGSCVSVWGLFSGRVDFGDALARHPRLSEREV
jgi:hypothetical protein